MQMLSNKWIKTAALFLAVMLVGTGTSLAQVTVSLNDITGRPGETATVAVSVSGVEAGTAVQSFGFTISSDAGVTFTGSSTASTLSGDAGFGVNSNTATGAVGGFSQGTNVTTSGNLVNLTFSLDTDGSAGSVTLSNFVFNAGDPAVAGTLSSEFTVSNRIISVSDASVGVMEDFNVDINLDDALLTADAVVAFSLDLNYDPTRMSIRTSAGTNGVITGGITSGVSVNAVAIDSDTYRIAGFTGTAMTGSGLFISVAATATNNGGTGDWSVSNVIFNAGTPVYAGRIGTLTVVPINFAPVFTAELSDTSMLEDGGAFSFDYDATDANSDAITFALTAGPGSIDSASGVYDLTPAGSAGVHTVTVTASDGVNTTSTSATVTVKQVDLFEANLAGFNENPPAETVGSGWVTMRMVADDGLLEVVFSVSNLAAAMTASNIHIAGVGQNGGVSVSLAPPSDSFSASYDITGNTDVIDALRAGDAYVNVHSSAYPAGELRGQVLAAGNSAPSAATSSAPDAVIIAGDPGSTLYAVSWLPASDPDGDTVNYLLQMSTNSSFTEIVSLEAFGVTNGMVVTVGEAAVLFDQLTMAVPGSVDIGGSVSVFHRVITTDGSLWSAGTASSLTLTRGLVTDTEPEGSLPTVFTLQGNYPNPFNPTTTIQFDLPESADVTVQILDLLGREVLSVPSQTLEAGAGRSIQINASNLASGIYLYRVIANGATTTSIQVKTMTLLK